MPDTFSLKKIIERADIHIMPKSKEIFFPSELNSLKKAITLAGFINKRGKYKVKLTYRISNDEDAEKNIESDWIEIYLKSDL